MEKTVEQLQAELTAKQTEIDALKARVDAMEAEAHQKLVEAAADARFKAGLASDRKAEADRLKAKTADVLKDLILDAGVVAKRVEANTPRVPQATYGEGDEDKLEAAMDKAAESLGFARAKEAET